MTDDDRNDLPNLPPEPEPTEPPPVPMDETPPPPPAPRPPSHHPAEAEPRDVAPEAPPSADVPGQRCCRGHLLLVLGIALLALVSFAPALRLGFLGEDVPYVQQNESIRSLRNIPLFFSASYWNRPLVEGGRAYRPLVEVSLALDHAVWGLRPFGFHLTNLLLHVLVSLTVYLVVWQVVRHRLAALVAAGIFAVHPVHAEAVNVVRNRGDLLATLFLLWSFLAFAWMVDRLHARQSAGLRPVSAAGSVLLGVVLFILALMTKETAITLPVLLLIYTAALVPIGWRSWAAAQTLVWWVALWGYLALLAAAVQRYAPAQFVNVEEGGRALLLVRSLGRNLLLLVAPVWLNPQHPFDPLVTGARWQAWPVILTLVVLALLVIVCLAVFRRHRLVAFGIAWVLITLLPVSNVVPLGWPWIAEHRLYLPSVGVGLLAGAIIGALAVRRLDRRPPIGGALRVGLIAAAVLAALYLGWSVVRAVSWKSVAPAQPQAADTGRAEATG